jgi:hypothetical protein
MAILAWLCKIQKALHECAKSIRHAEHRKRQERMPTDKPIEVRAIIAYDEKTVAEAKAESGKNHTTQEGIRKATWAAVGAASVYAVITLFMWCAMIQQNKIAGTALQKSTDSFRMDERAWIEIEPIKGSPFSPRIGNIGAGFIYPIYIKNVGKTVARNIQLRGMRNGFDAHIEFGDDPKQVAWEQDQLLMGKVANTEKMPLQNPIPKVLGPQATSPIPVMFFGQEPQVFTSKSGTSERVHYIVGRIDYADAFGIQHWHKFCFFISNPKGELWHCKEGNDEDDNPEAP